MSVSQSNRDSLCSTADSDCSALSAASDSVALQLRHTQQRLPLDSSAALHRHSLTSVTLRELERERERDAFHFQPIAAAGHGLTHSLAQAALDASDCDIPQQSVQSPSAHPSAAPVADPVPDSSTSTPFSGYYSASSSLSLPSLVGPSLRPLPLQQPALPSSASANPGSELHSVMSASTSSAPLALAHVHAHSAAQALVHPMAGTSASADVLLIRPTPIKLAAQHGHESSASSQSLAHAHSNSNTVPAGGAFSHVNTALVYERELCNLMQRTALDQQANNNRFPQSGRAIARVRRSRTPSQATNVSPPRCSSQPSEAQPASTTTTSGCVCARAGGVIEFSDGACGACAMAAARAANRKRRWRRRPADSNSVDCEPGSFNDSQLASGDDSPSSDCDDRDELDAVSSSSVTDSPARCDSKCRRRFVAASTGSGARPSINAEKMLTVVSLSDLNVQQCNAPMQATSLNRFSVEADAQPVRRERERDRSRHSHSHRRPVSQIFELRRVAPVALDALCGFPSPSSLAAGSGGVHTSFSMMENQLASMCSNECEPSGLHLRRFAPPLTPTQLQLDAQSADEQSDSPNSDDDELLEAAAACVGVGLASTSRFASTSDNCTLPDAGEVAILELDIEQIENN